MMAASIIESPDPSTYGPEGEDWHARARASHTLDRPAGGDLADDRQDVLLAEARLGNELRRQPQMESGGGREADGSRLGRAALEVAVALEDLEVVMDRGGRRQPDSLGDLADRRRIAAGAQGRRDEVEDVDLAFGVVPCHRRLLSDP
jgi:hypothetical protein